MARERESFSLLAQGPPPPPGGSPFRHVSVSKGARERTKTKVLGKGMGM